MTTAQKPNDASTREVGQVGFHMDKLLWLDIDNFLSFASGKGDQMCDNPDKTSFNKKTLVAHILYVQWNRSAMLCSATREAVLKRFGGISPMLRKPCVGFGCAVCKKYEECKSGKYDGHLDPFNQVVASERYAPLTVDQLNDQHLFLHQQEQRQVDAEP